MVDKIKARLVRERLSRTAEFSTSLPPSTAKERIVYCYYDILSIQQLRGSTGSARNSIVRLRRSVPTGNSIGLVKRQSFGSLMPCHSKCWTVIMRPWSGSISPRGTAFYLLREGTLSVFRQPPHKLTFMEDEKHSSEISSADQAQDTHSSGAV